MPRVARASCWRQRSTARAPRRHRRFRIPERRAAATERMRRARSLKGLEALDDGALHGIESGSLGEELLLPRIEKVQYLCRVLVEGDADGMLDRVRQPELLLGGELDGGVGSGEK